MQRSRADLPVVTIGLAVTVVAVFAMELADDGMAFCYRFGFVAADPSLGRALSSLFLHDPEDWTHAVGNIVFLIVLGRIVERAIGSLHFLAVYLLAGVGGASMHVVVDPTATTPLVGASGALFGLLAFAGVRRPELLGFVVTFVGLNIWHAFGGPGGANVSFGCHLGGFVAGTSFVLLTRVRPDDLGRSVAG